MNDPEMKVTSNPKNPVIDEYIGQYPQVVQDKLNQVRELIHDTLPNVTEKISWSMPTFQWKGRNLFHIAANKQHLGVYPGPAPIVAFAKELEVYKTSKGAIQIPYTEEIPKDLLKKIILFNKAKLEEILDTKDPTK